MISRVNSIEINQNIETKSTEINSNNTSNKVLKKDIFKNFGKFYQEYNIHLIIEVCIWVSNLETGNLRFCVDPEYFCKLIRKQKFLTPTLKDFRINLNGENFCSVLKNGYCHFEVKDNFRKLCTFSTSFQ